MITIPADSNVIDDFRNVEIKNGIPQIKTYTKERGENVVKRTEKRHGDTAIAAVLAEFAYGQDDYQPFEYESIEKNEWALGPEWDD